MKEAKRDTKLMDEIIVAMEEGDIEEECSEEDSTDNSDDDDSSVDNPASFLPTKSAKHRPPKKFKKGNVAEESKTSKQQPRRKLNTKSSKKSPLENDPNWRPISPITVEECRQAFGVDVELTDDNSAEENEDHVGRPASADADDARPQSPVSHSSTSSTFQAQSPVITGEPLASSTPSSGRGRGRGRGRMSGRIGSPLGHQRGCGTLGRGVGQGNVNNSIWASVDPGSQLPPKTQLVDNPPIVTFLTGAIKKCCGCNTIFKEENRRFPNDFVFKMKARRMRPGQGGEWFLDPIKKPAYYHCKDMGCVQTENPYLDRRDIWMMDATFNALKPEHLVFLKAKNFWDPIINNRQLMGKM
jgi:hypothetical protein